MQKKIPLQVSSRVNVLKSGDLRGRFLGAKAIFGFFHSIFSFLMFANML
jgi:hypothetical protein